MPIQVELIDVLKRLNLESMDLDDMVALMSAAEGVKITYEKYKMRAPDFLGEAISLLDRDIKSKRRDYLMRQRKILEAKKQRLKSKEEVKIEVDNELAEIDNMLKE